MGIIYSHWVQSLNICMKSIDSHNENFWGHSFLVLLLAEFIAVNKFFIWFINISVSTQVYIVYKGYINEIKELCTDYH